jgi:AraC-like DNA-binding protein
VSLDMPPPAIDRYLCAKDGGIVMPSSTIVDTHNIDEFAMALRPSDTEHMIMDHGAFAARITRIDLHRLWMQRGQESHTRIGHAQQSNNRASIVFSTSPETRIVWKGVEVAGTDIALGCHNQPYWSKMTGPSRWGSMSLPVEDLAHISAAVSGRDLTLPRNGLTMTPSPSSLARLLKLHAAAGHLAARAPELLCHGEAARGIEQALMDAMFACLEGPQVRSSSATWRDHSAIVRRLRAMLEENVDQPIYVPELCQALGVPERTLRKHCYDHLGMSPKKYLLLRRLNLAHRALLAADPSTTTVTEIATNFGFWELGRFATEYRAWCGESPSASLRRSRA